MSSKWFIPMSLGAFAVLVGGPWLYLSITQDRAVRAASRSSVDILRDPRFVDLAERTSSPPTETEPEAPTTGETPRRGESVALHGRSSTRAAGSDRRHPQTEREISAREFAGVLAERLDEASVKLRGDLDKTAVTQFARGTAAAQEGRHEEALTRFERAIGRDPHSVAAHAARAAALVELGRFVEAADAYAEVVRLSPKDAAARYNYAVVLYRFARYHEAASQLREAVALDPRHAQAHYNLASIAQREGRLREARDAWEHFTRLRPGVASAWFNLGVVYMDLDQPVEATACFAAVTETTPDDADAYVNLGIASALAGEYEQALAAMQRADALEPCDETIMMYLAALHDLVADSGGPQAAQHRHLAAMFQEQVENTWLDP